MAPMDMQGSSLVVQTTLPLGHLEGRGGLERLNLQANLPVSEQIPFFWGGGSLFGIKRKGA